MSETASLLGLPAELTFEGRAYRLAPRSFDVEGLFELWLERQARDAVERHRPHMLPAEYACQLDGWRRDCATRAYAFGGALATQALCSPEGAKHMAYLQLKKASGEVTEALVDRMWRDPAARSRLQELIWAEDAGPLGDQAQAPPPA